MIKNTVISLLFMLVLFIQPVAATFSQPNAQLQIIPKSQELWTCFDYSIDYAIHHPDYGIVVKSANPVFHGVSHMINYKMDDNGTMLIHDGLYNADYKYSGWYNDGYYHFLLNGEKPVRQYMFMRDNSDVILKEYNITKHNFEY